MKKVVLVATALIAAYSVGAFAEDVGVVDMKTIFVNSPKAQAIKIALRKELTKKFDPEQEKIVKMSDALKADLEKYQKNESVMDAKDLEALRTKIINQQIAYRNAQSKLQNQVAEVQNKSLDVFMDSVKAAAKEVGVKDKLQLILPSTEVLYSENSKDVTKDVIDNMK